MSIAVALSLFVAAPAASAVPTAAPPKAAEPQKKLAKPGKNMAEDFDLAQMMAFIDKLFPAQPDPDPARLALARTSANGVLPNGTYARMFEELMGSWIDRFLGMSEADFKSKGAEGKPADRTTLRQELAKDDPHFEERMRIMRRVIGEELAKISVVIEPKLREGLARSIARRFTEPQLKDINAFFATDSGRAFGSQSMLFWVDPDVMRSMIQTFPDMMAAMPGAMKRLEAATAHLPKPPKKKSEADEEPAEDEDLEEEEEAELPEA